MKKQLIYGALATASLLPLAADAHGFGRGGSIGLLLLLVIPLLMVIAVVASAFGRPRL